MPKINISEDQAIKLLEDAVAERGRDYVYQTTNIGGCHYERDGVPSCGIGLALSKAGVSVESLRKMDNSPSGVIGALFFEGRLEGLGILIDTRAIQAFSKFQREQDTGTPWGEALDNTKQLLNRLTK